MTDDRQYKREIIYFLETWCENGVPVATSGRKRFLSDCRTKHISEKGEFLGGLSEVAPEAFDGQGLLKTFGDLEGAFVCGGRGWEGGIRKGCVFSDDLLSLQLPTEATVRREGRRVKWREEVIFVCAND